MGGLGGGLGGWMDAVVSRENWVMGKSTKAERKATGRRGRLQGGGEGEVTGRRGYRKGEERLQL